MEGTSYMRSGEEGKEEEEKEGEEEKEEEEKDGGEEDKEEKKGQMNYASRK